MAVLLIAVSDVIPSLLLQLIYESFTRYLVEHKGYDKDLLNLTPATWDFCFKGLVVDLEDGNLVKLAEDGTVLRYSLAA
ncbi:5'-nucleotidase domain-containing protein 1 [Collichthys lucidus]|uniref:5'-nucleotidase domain-containing protein 1 n=1 Tax=Collichthys lucidus TaxID=240159 RepID=A0A4U5UN87_COLLU|nr:5'-nucleotidase domain-containing protein 1 [Collichthys lucidus]